MQRIINRFARGLAIAAASAAIAAASPFTPVAQADQPDVSIVGDRTAGAAVASDDPRATAAAWTVLRHGGRAVDAAIAAAMVLSVAIPDAVSLAGAGAALRYDAANRQIAAYVGREISPKAVDPDVWMKSLRGMSPRALDGGRSVGAPTLLQMLGLMHKAGGSMPWSELTVDAEALARAGVPISERAAWELSRIYVPPDSGIEQIFGPSGPRAIPAGTVVRNPELGDVLAAIGRDGPDVLRGGVVGKSIAEAVAHTSRRPSPMTLEEISAAAPTEAPPLCVALSKAALCSTPAPTNGAVTLETVALFEATRPKKPTAYDWAHLLAQSHRHAAADARRYLADPRRWPDLTPDLLTPRQIARRARGVRQDRNRGLPSPARLANAPRNVTTARPRSRKAPTASVVVVDMAGDAVALSLSLSKPFGSGLAARGVILNGANAAFDPPAEGQGMDRANALRSGVRPRLDLSPIMALDQDRQLLLAAAAMGGANGPAFLAKAAIAVLTFDKSAAAAVAAPNVASANRITNLEVRTPAERLEDRLRDVGHTVKLRDLDSGLALIRRKDGKFQAAADPRGLGTAKSAPPATARPLDSMKRGS